MTASTLFVSVHQSDSLCSSLVESHTADGTYVELAGWHAYQCYRGMGVLVYVFACVFCIFIALFSLFLILLVVQSSAVFCLLLLIWSTVATLIELAQGYVFEIEGG